MTIRGCKRYALDLHSAATLHIDHSVERDWHAAENRVLQSISTHFRSIFHQDTPAQRPMVVGMGASLQFALYLFITMQHQTSETVPHGATLRSPYAVISTEY
jgi:hypothetical protein